MTPEEHKARHQTLHQSLDELFADYITQHPSQLNYMSMTVLQLANWSAKQKEQPDHEEKK